MNIIALNFVDLFVFVANGLIVAEIIASWLPSMRQVPGMTSITGMADVVLWPVRAVIRPKGRLDWSPLTTIIMLQLLQSGLHNVLI